MSTETLNSLIQNEERRTRESPRLKAFNEVNALIDAQIAQWKTEEGDETVLNIALDTLNALKDRVDGLVSGHSSTSVGKHFVGVVKDTGERVYLSLTKAPSKASLGDRFSSVFSFKTRKGADWVVANGFRDSDQERKVF